MSQRTCFVIMGFGKKTDYEIGKTIDLDETYSEIIKPAVESLSMRCVRADEIDHSGLIDRPMYQLLLQADLVIADISTANVNAIYELGVRHALRPHATIVMKDSEGRFSFDLNHLNTFTYRHLGEEIGCKEAKRAINELKSLIESVMSKAETDSPVYAFLPELNQPLLTDGEIDRIVERVDRDESAYSNFYSMAMLAIKEGRFIEAINALEECLKIRPGEPYLKQSLALSIYKSKRNSELKSLMDAWDCIGDLNPDSSNDPETLGISGAIHKKIWMLTKDEATLDSAISFYRRGFELRRDYYNGENYATCLLMKAGHCSDVDTSGHLRYMAKGVYRDVISVVDMIIKSSDFDSRSDKRWVFATRANSSLALKDDAGYKEYSERFFGVDPSPADWEVESFSEHSSLIRSILGE